MTVGMPKIEINFKQKATSLIERSERGYAVLIMRDNTSALFNCKTYTEVTDVEDDSKMYTSENLQYIKDAFEFGTFRVVVVKIGESEEDTISTALKIVEKNVDTGWVTICNGKTEDFTTLTSWTKAKENSRKTYKSVVYKVNTTDCRHVVNFYNDKVTFTDDRAEQTGEKYLPTLAGIFAVCNINKGCVNFKCTNLSNVEEVEDNDAALEEGRFILYNDKNYVRIANDVNSLTTLNGKTLTEDMRYIETVEAMDLITDDIRSEFKENYQGPYKNKYDNQVLFISAVKGYFRNLSEEDILDEEYENDAFINVEKQRAAWIATGKEEAKDWNEITVKKKTYKRSLFLGGDIKILGSMVNLDFDISLF
ncbi:phage tail sheath C-terminal domain-containing protein [Clostridium botulinum]|uniref:phage tail sheath C-terminal domain-containing protein n=1 Tax=Clostridium botulinum TaxID=1491 RepID=UPI0013FE929D|nr:phage tail sheath C-terminal domain-containing protein [Clostridium botulinum]MBY6915484.1 phage tail protein [Clostridium botulinum]NFQ38298.1 phage tail protein [Clostridium botulinum]